MNVKSIGQILKFITDKKNRNLILGVCVAAALLIAVPFFEPKAEAKRADEKGNTPSAEDYRTLLTRELEAILSQMEGVGKAEVLLTMENGVENIYKEEEKISQSGGEFPGIVRRETQSPSANLQRESQVLVVRDNDGGENPVLVKQIEPKVSGVIVVCDGGARESVAYQVTNAVKALLDVPSNRIQVIKRKT